MKQLLLFVLMASILFTSCVKSYTDKPVIFKESLQEKIVNVVGADGIPLMVADSGYRPGINREPVFQATSKPRNVTKKVKDTTAHFNPPALLVRKWLGASNYYDGNLLIAILLIAGAAALLFSAKTKAFAKKGFMIITIPAAILIAVAFGNIQSKPYNISNENEKWLPIDEWRKVIAEDPTMIKWWEKAYEEGRILFSKRKSK